MRKMRRTEVSCAECRRRKLKCEGTRPSCSRCQIHRLECSYSPPVSTVRRTGIGRGDLLKRIESLEERLRAVTANQQMQVLQSTSSDQQGREIETTDERVPVDELSTQALTKAADGEIGYFGPSSNYAMIRLLSKLYTETTMQFPPANTHTVQALKLPCSDCEERQQPQRSSHTNRVGEISSSRDIYHLPPLGEAMALLERYFSTIGVVLPYIKKATAVDVYHTALQHEPSKRCRTSLAVLNIVWAHAAASLGLSQRETFYQRSVALLDSRDLERPSYELVQVLLLLVEYKQNHQRSISSYTAHALCVKAAFHIGLHSRTVRASSGSVEDKTLRLRLWNGVLKNEREVCPGFRRPGMVSDSLSVDENELVQRGNQNASDMSSYAIIGQALESLYDENIDLADRSQSPTLLAKWTEVTWRTDEFRDGLSTLGGPVSGAELPTLLITMPSIEDGHRLAVRILLSIHYNRLRMLANFPLIIHGLSMSMQLEGEEETSSSLRINRLRQRLSQILHEDGDAAREVCAVISALSTYRQTFIDEFAAWYTCNYTMLTVTLHFLALLLMKKHDPHSLPAMTLPEIRHQIENSLLVMGDIGKNSLITQKAGCCIRRMLVVFDTLGTQARTAPVSDLDPIPADCWNTDYVMQDIARFSQELLEQMGRDEGGSGELDPSFLDLYSRIPVCE
ncbi:hypothetical protein BJX99DRAFT_267878 [Aspergillus californicus]